MSNKPTVIELPSHKPVAIHFKVAADVTKVLNTVTLLFPDLNKATVALTLITENFTAYKCIMSFKPNGDKLDVFLTRDIVGDSFCFKALAFEEDSFLDFLNQTKEVPFALAGAAENDPEGMASQRNKPEPLYMMVRTFEVTQ